MGKESAIQVSNINEYAIAKMAPEDLSTLIATTVGTSGLGVTDMPRIKLPLAGATQWLVPSADDPDSGTPVKALEGVVIYQHDARALFYTREDGGISNEPPLCYSATARTGSGNPGGTCAICPNAKFGTAPKGGKGQACKLMHHVYFVMQGFLLPYVIVLPPSSVGAWRKYMVSLISGGKPATSVVTRITLEKVTGSVAPYARVVPSFVRSLSAEEQKTVDAYAASIVPAIQGVQQPVEDASLEGLEEAA